MGDSSSYNLPGGNPEFKNTHRFQDDEGDEEEKLPKKALKVGFSDQIESWGRIICTAPSPREISPSPEDTANGIAKRITRERLAIYTGSNSTVPSLSPASSIITEGGLTDCGDGGQDYERLYLEKNPDKISPRSYPQPGRVLEKVRKDLNASGTKIRSAAPPRSFFIPCTNLYGIMSLGNIALMLRECYPNTDLGTMTKEAVALSFRRTFAVLILIRKEMELRWFFERDLDDSRIPFDFDDMNHPEADYVDLILRWDWETEDFINFCRRRLEVSPVFFAVKEPGRKEKIVHYQCREGEVLPFVEHRWTVRGGFGEVSAYKLHENQQDLHRYTNEGSERPIAVKKLYRAEGDQEFKQEYNILDRLIHLRTPHIAKLLGSYEIPRSPSSRDYFLIFECADLSLSEIWKRNPGDWAASLFPEIREKSHGKRIAYFAPEEISRWAAIQAYGLARALMKLHDLGPHRKVDDLDNKNHGLHGDLKPDNILHYKNWTGVQEKLGVLQITDFGLSSFHCTQSADDIVLRRGTNVYRPPEAAILSPLSASFDTWSLGCLFIEFLTWLVRGPEGLKAFRDKRLGSSGFAPSSSHACFWEVVENDGCTVVSLSSVVIKWVIDIHNDPNSSQFVQDFSALIVNEMLVIEEFEEMGTMRETKGTVAHDKGKRLEERALNSPATKRIGTGNLSEILALYKSKEPGYFKPSTVKRPHRLQERGHCIVLPKPLYQINQDAKGRALRGRSGLSGAG